MKRFLKITMFFVAVSFFLTCGSTHKDENTTYTITKIQGEKDGQTLFLTDNKGNLYTTIISIPNGNFVKVSEGDVITLDVKQLMDMTPPAIVSKNIKIISPK